MSKLILLQVGVKVFLRNHEGKYLLLKRSPERYPEIKNNWDIPGGRIVPGTSLLANLQREVLEETGLTILQKPELLDAQDILKAEKHIVRLTFLASADGEPILAGEDIEARWCTLEEIKNNQRLDEFTREILEKHFSRL